MSIAQMHRRANLLSLEQRRQKQLLSLLFIYKNRHANVLRVHGRNTRAANVPGGEGEGGGQLCCFLLGCVSIKSKEIGPF